MQIAIFGASGLLGRHALAAAIADGRAAVAIARRPAALAALGAPVRQADLDDPASLRQALAGIDAVIQCAAFYPGAPRPWADDVAYALGQMERFYAAAAEAGIKRIVYLGGAIALARRSDGKPATEVDLHPSRPRDANAYVQVKWALDQQAMAQAQAGLPVITAIPTMSLGEFDDGHSTGRLVLDMARGTMPGYIEGRRNLIYAGDAARGLLATVDRGTPGERYLLADRNLAMSELMAMIARATGRPMPARIPLPVARAVAGIQAMRHRWLGGPLPKISASAIAVMALGQFIDGGKARTALGFAPAITTEEAIDRTLRWQRAQGLILA